MSHESNPNNLTPGQIAEDAIGLFLEYRDRHGYDEERARAAAVAEVIEGAAVDIAKLYAEMDEGAKAPSLRSGAMSAPGKD